MTYGEIEVTAARSGLAVLGGFHPDADDPILAGSRTLVLFGPRESGFWAAFQKTPEYLDRTPDAIDQWSSWVITALGRDLDGQPFYPFGKPHEPFVSWALKSGRAWGSPVHLLVHDTGGLSLALKTDC